MKKIEYPKDQKLTGVRVNQVWLKEDLLQSKSANRVHLGLWKIFHGENKSPNAEERNYIELLKKFILSATDLYIVFLDTETKTERGFDIGGWAFLTDRKDFMDITMLMICSNLAGCRCKHIEQPYEDFINEFIGEVYF